MDFDQVKVVVTGGGAGIGLAVAKQLASRGGQVACLDLDPSAVSAPMHGFVCDVADDRAVRNAVQAAAEWLGGIDVVVNNAGIGALGDVAANSDEQWHRLFDVNVFSIARVTRAALPWLRASSRAAIVNTCSAVATTGLPNRALYSATKGAVLALTRAMAADFVAQPIRVNCVTPGVVATPWQARAVANARDPDAVRRQLEGFQPIGRVASAEEVAGAIAYLASPSSGSTTGVELPVDGGLSALRLPVVA
jgi:NAD(P)-dependent dehydrogenase (short-subunit alcohol dehydrogenase family)